MMVKCKLLLAVIFFAWVGCKQRVETLSSQLDTVSIMSFNILYGGDEFDFNKIVEAIQKANPDVVGIQEAEGNIPKLAEALGWKYYDSRLHLISQVPLISDSVNGWYYTFAEIKPGRLVAISNLHLPSDPYGPELVRDGLSLDSVIANEYTTRYYELNKHRELLPPLVVAGYPLLLTGDFNAPSHRDWSEASINSRFHMKYSVEWPISKNLEELGFIDTYRSKHADPVMQPGLTWTPGYPPPFKKQNETHDRIDFIWAAGIESVLDSRIIGEEGGPNVDIAIAPYPSDHRGVLTTCLVRAVSTSDFVQAYPWVSMINDSLLVQYNSKKSAAKAVTILDEDGKEIKVISLTRINRDEVWIDLPTAPSGKYSLHLKANDDSIIARNTFWRKSELDKAELKLSKNTFKSGESIAVEWKNSPGHRLDWIAIYPAKAKTEEDYNQVAWNSKYMVYEYTMGAVNGKLILSEKSKINTWPLPVGEYSVHLLLDDGFQSITHTTIKIVN